MTNIIALDWEALKRKNAKAKASPELVEALRKSGDGLSQGLSAAEVREYHIEQQKAAIVAAMRRLAAYGSRQEMLDFVRATIRMFGGLDR